VLLSVATLVLVLVTLLGAPPVYRRTITLSAPDATAYVNENPFWPGSLHGHRVIVTLVLIALPFWSSRYCRGCTARSSCG
jgi:hypothetical protein